jgi:hypothetical protein
MPVENVVVDASSIDVNRRARRAKTDRLDVGTLLALPCGGSGGNARSACVPLVRHRHGGDHG